MTKHNERFPDDPEAAMMSAYRELLEKVRAAGTIDEVENLGRMLQETAEATPPGPHRLLQMQAQRITMTAKMRLASAEEVSDG